MAQSQEWNLPPLAGSEEDKAWAQVIRAKAIAHNREYHHKLTSSKGLNQDEELRAAIVSAADAALREVVTEHLAAMISDGSYKVILDKYGLGANAVAQPMMNASTQ